MSQALRNLLTLAESQLDQSATHDGLKNCEAIAAARTALEDVTDDFGTVFSPVCQDGSVGFKVTTKAGSVSFLRLNPSGGSDVDGESNAFLYHDGGWNDLFCTVVYVNV